MTNLLAKTKAKAILSAVEALDLPAVFSGSREADEALRTELLSMLLAEETHNKLAVQYLSQTTNPALAVKAATYILTLAGNNAQ